MTLLAYDKETDQWMEGEIVSVALKIDDEVRYFYGDNIKEKPNGKNQSVSDAEAHVVD